MGTNAANDFNEGTRAALIDGDYKLMTGRQVSAVNYPNPQDDYALCKLPFKLLDRPFLLY